MITITDMVQEVQRELELRRKVFPRWIQEGKISRETADRRIQVMEAIRDRLVVWQGIAEVDLQIKKKK